MSKAAILNKATGKKDDEFYTPFAPIERELSNYHDVLRSKKVLCNCRDLDSNFDLYFRDTFQPMQLCVVGERHFRTYWAKGDFGLFKHWSEEELKCDSFSYDDYFGKQLLSNYDVVVTNPPFSKIRHFLQTIVEAGKDFIIVAPITAVGNKAIGNYLVEGKLRVGYTRITEPFLRPDGSEQKFGNVVWFTSFPVVREKKLKLTKMLEFDSFDIGYVFYDNLPNVLYVPRAKDIPIDYSGIMSVPLSYLQYHDDNDFEIVDGRTLHDSEYGILAGYESKIGGEYKFTRILIRRRT